MSPRFDRQPEAEPRTDYRRFFELSPQMLCTMDPEACFVEVNPTFAAVLGYAADHLVGRPYTDFVHPGDAAMSPLEAATTEADSGVPALDCRFRRADGEYRWLSWSLHRDTDHDLVYAAALDVTAHREQAAVVDNLLAELERSNTDLAQFAYVASHDLSEPLRMVSSYVQLLAERYAGQLDADADEFIGFAVDGAARMKALIDDLLAYSRSGTSSVIRRPVDCTALVGSALADLDLAITASGGSVRIGDLPTVTGDPGQLAQVFQNLLSNALKFVPPGQVPHIEVSAEREGQAWCFAVEDNGIGIDAGHRDRIFLMFKRLHGRAEYPGTGIGLALCHKIVSRFGGRIWIDGRAGGGSIFRFTLPDAGFTEVG
jgi:PAS domain S-box-containing protein